MNKNISSASAENKVSKSSKDIERLRLIKSLREMSKFPIEICSKAVDEAKNCETGAEISLKRLAMRNSSLKIKKETKSIMASIAKGKSHKGVPSSSASIVQTACESDATLKTPQFKAMSQAICEHILLARPLYRITEEVEEDHLNKVKQKIESRLKKESSNLTAQQMEEESLRLASKELEESVLATQIMHINELNQEITVQDFIALHIAFFNENIAVTDFTWF